jgi:hypothetical protein
MLSLRTHHKTAIQGVRCTMTLRTGDSAEQINTNLMRIKVQRTKKESTRRCFP